MNKIAPILLAGWTIFGCVLATPPAPAPPAAPTPAIASHMIAATPSANRFGVFVTLRKA
jgi:hypothetical protein